jgi:hypothetical protein
MNKMEILDRSESSQGIVSIYSIVLVNTQPDR